MSSSTLVPWYPVSPATNVLLCCGSVSSPGILMLNKNTQSLASLCKLEKDIPSGPAEACADRSSTTSFLSASTVLPSGPALSLRPSNPGRGPSSLSAPPDPSSWRHTPRTVSARQQILHPAFLPPRVYCLLSPAPLRLRIPGSLSSGPSPALMSRSPTPAPRVPGAC